MEQHFELIYQTSFQFDSLIELQQFCTDLMVKSPVKIFKSLDFTSISEKALVQFIKKDDLQMKEIEIWEHLLKWGLAQNPTLNPDPTTWSDEDSKTMENTLQHCLPLIRFFSLSSKEFLQKVRPYKKLLKREIYENLLNSHLDPESEPTDNILLPRNIRFDGIIDSKITDLSIVSIISRWINKVDVNSNFSHLRELYLPYKFQLLIRGSRDGFTPKRFHQLCDGKPYTVTFMKVKGTEEILGGYNPLKWESSGGLVNTKDSFIFSFKNKNAQCAIISNIVNEDRALYYCKINGPDFCDFSIWARNESIDYDNFRYRKSNYEKRVKDIDGDFIIEDYEVFQITKR
ncbi:hypothetical protein GLOIN_2v1509986 [Rhizophagus irregularis DAOM 181602=DAOM 197198]|nr:hypothetical protein GLOIN_2v1509986 [Rhizophagus irregularis DAOM 181602=DAOM 197198]POG81343.1 hypothetical protein GLOIN_2v1509986 [Rhizophagus irregularis DAOM 181602=DAOM 197198]|eukprot:XP_025188209.1 hypothetical protein GLOIN_2v1509986 [Rhizophagus irregularis DAOM 181602=DAOM 197198]